MQQFVTLLELSGRNQMQLSSEAAPIASIASLSESGELIRRLAGPF